MIKLKKFEFVESVGSLEVKNEVKKIISEMFSSAKNMQFSGDNYGESEYVEFEIDFNDFKITYNEALVMEYSENVMKKRKYQVSLNFDSKYKEGSIDHLIYKIKFRIDLKMTSDIKFETEILGWCFDEKPVKSISFIKNSKQKCEWNDSTNCLTISKSSFNKMDNTYLKLLINEEGGDKVRIK